MSVIGYDNIDLTEYYSPPLTTVHQPKRRLGKTAVKLLLARINDNDTQQQVFEMDLELISRESVKTIN
jgi:transcriptional regulator, LacI family